MPGFGYRLKTLRKLWAVRAGVLVRCDLHALFYCMSHLGPQQCGFDAAGMAFAIIAWARPG